MASTVRPRSPPGRRNRCGSRPGVLELDEHQVLGIVVDVFAGVYHVVVAVNTTVEVGPGVFGCDGSASGGCSRGGFSCACCVPGVRSHG
jgi:hypothetical protein